MEKEEEEEEKEKEEEERGGDKGSETMGTTEVTDPL